MSNNLDFFGTQSGNSGQRAGVPAADVDQRFGLPGTSWQPAASLTTATPVRPRVSARTLMLLLVVVLVALGGGGYYLVHRPHAVPLPGALGGLPRFETHDSLEAAQLKSAKSKYAKLGIHGVSIGFYANSSNPARALVVVAGRGSGSADLNQPISALTAEPIGPGETLNSVTAGGTTLQCESVTEADGSGAACIWHGADTFLVALGSDLTAQDVANDLDEMRTADSLN